MVQRSKKLVIIAGKCVLGFVVFVLAYLGIAWCLSRITVDREAGQPEEMAIYIKTNGVHTDLVLPLKSDLMD